MSEILRPTGVVLNGWSGLLSAVTDPLNAPNSATYIESPTFQLDQLNYGLPVVFTYANPSAISNDTVRVRTVLQRTGTTGDLTFQSRVIIKYVPFGGNISFPQVRVFSSTRTITEDNLSQHEVLDAFSFDSRTIQQIVSVRVEYRLSPSGVYDSVLNTARHRVMSATNATLRLINISLEFENVVYTPNPSPPGSPPTTSTVQTFWDITPAYVTPDQKRESILPERFIQPTVGFTGNIKQLQDPPGSSDVRQIYEAAVTATYSSSSTLSIGVELPGPRLSYDSDGHLNLRWRAILSNNEVSEQRRDFSITVYYREKTTGERFWLTTTLESLEASYQDTAAATWFSTSIALPLPAFTLVDNFEIVIRPYGTATSTIVGISSLLYAFASFAPLYFSPPAPPLPPSGGGTLLPPSPPLFDVPGSPPVGGSETPFVPSGGPYSPPPPVPSVSPPGSEVLRPNRDIRNVLFNPRPLWMQLNEPVGGQSYVAAPAEVDYYDENTGDRLRSFRAHFEVGMTQPQTVGPWKALQVRFEAARSMPPTEEQFTSLDACVNVVEDSCPPPQVLKPTSSQLGNGWAPGPAHWALDEPFYAPDGCFITKDLAQDGTLKLSFESPTIDLNSIDGWQQYNVKVRARLRAVDFVKSSAKISGIGGQNLLFTGNIGYQVRFEPLNCFGSANAFVTSSTRLEGTAVLRSNIETYVKIRLISPHHTVVPLISVDGQSYGLEARVLLTPLSQKVIYYSVEINQNGDTPVNANPYTVGVELSLDGDVFVSNPVIQTGGVTFQVVNEDITNIKSDSVTRLKAELLGGSFFGLRAQRSPLLKNTWVDYTFSFKGRPFSTHSFRDLNLQLSTETLVLAPSQFSVVDIDVVSLEAVPYCEVVTPLPAIEVSDCELVLIPKNDVAATNWSQAPYAAKLVSTPAQAERTIYVETNTLQNNSLILGFGFEEEVTILDRAKKYDEIVVQLAVRAFDSYRSMNTKLNIGMNYGGTQSVYPTNTWAIHEVVWTFSEAQAFDIFDGERLRLTLSAVSEGAINVASRVQVAAIRAFLKCADQQVVANTSTVSIPPFSGTPSLFSYTPAPTPILPTLNGVRVSALPSIIEVYSCGSLRSCPLRPDRPAFNFSVENKFGDGPALVQIDVYGSLQFWITPSAIDTVLEGELTRYDVYLAAGSAQNKFPAEAQNGLIRIVVSCPGESDQVFVVRWIYRGLD